jgi:hypothetical protein
MQHWQKTQTPLSRNNVIKQQTPVTSTKTVTKNIDLLTQITNPNLNPIKTKNKPKQDSPTTDNSAAAAVDKLKFKEIITVWDIEDKEIVLW